jgi:hypothetical protein
MAILTADSLLLPSAVWILVVSCFRAASLNEDEPTMEEAPPVDAVAAADADAVAATDVDAAALLLAGADDDELLLDEQAVSASSAPAPTPIAVANFLLNVPERTLVSPVRADVRCRGPAGNRRRSSGVRSRRPGRWSCRRW